MWRTLLEDLSPSDAPEGAQKISLKAAGKKFTGWIADKDGQIQVAVFTDVNGEQLYVEEFCTTEDVADTVKAVCKALLDHAKDAGHGHDEDEGEDAHEAGKPADEDEGSAEPHPHKIATAAAEKAARSHIDAIRKIIDDHEALKQQEGAKNAKSK